MIYLYSFLAIVAVLFIVSIPFAFYSDRKQRREIEKFFSGREKLSERDFYERYFADKDIPFFVVKRVREILEEEFGADMSSLSAR